MADELNRGLRERMSRAESASEAEVEWFLTRAKGKVPEEGEVEPALLEAAKKIRGCLDELPTFHAGALTLRFTPRAWSPALEDEFGVWTSLVVRLECAMYPSEKRRSVDELEAAAVCRLEEAIAKGQSQRERARLVKHARRHVRAAIRAYVKVRGVGRCVLPRAVRESL
jgi:hypothetical protein